MKIILAKTAGFCFGVERAVKLAFENQDKSNTYTFGPIIHNDSVVRSLAEKGIHSTENVHEGIDTLIIRSHGVAPDIYKSAKDNNITVVDATCPYVKKIHRLAERYFQQGYKIILIGNTGHPEIIGINGWAENKCIIVKDLEELKILNLSHEDNYLVVSQTTFKRGIVEEVVKYLEAEQYHFKYIDTVCDATKERQDEAAEIARRVNCMFVIGSSYSSNTRKLLEICKQECEKTYCIEDASCITDEMTSNCISAGITAGASTPSYLIKEVVNMLESK